MFIIPHSYPIEDLPEVVIGRWYVDRAFVAHARTHNVTVIDGTVFKSYHLGTEASGDKSESVSRNDWFYNRFLFASLKADGRLISSEMFC